MFIDANREEALQSRLDHKGVPQLHACATGHQWRIYAKLRPWKN